MSRASEAARARMMTDTPRVPTIAPVEAVNRAKQGAGVPTKPTDPLSPNGVAEVNGAAVKGADTPYTPLPDSLSARSRAALEAAGLTTLELAAAKTDEELDGISGVGEAAITAIRDAAKAAGLPEVPVA